jgi:excisionase family DNA binding protein
MIATQQGGEMEAFLTSSEAAEYLGVSRQRVDQLGSAGEIPRERMGTFWVYRREDLDRWQRESRRPAGRPKSDDERVINTDRPTLLPA